MTIYMQDRRAQAKRARVALTLLTAGALLLIGAVRAKAQTITVRPADTLRVVGGVSKPDTVRIVLPGKTDTVTVIKVRTDTVYLPTPKPPTDTTPKPPVDTTTPPPCSNCAHEPAGMATLTERPFAARNENGWQDINSGGGSMSIVNTPSGPTSPGTTGAIKYAKGCCAGGAPTDNNTQWSARPRTVYVRMVFMLSSNFYGHSESGVNKLLYVYAPTSNNDHAYLAAMGSGNGNLQPQLRWEGGAGNVNYTPNVVTGATISRGAWHVFEVLATGNTSGQRDGALDIWLDGVLISHYTGIRFNSGATTWSRLLQGSNYGGNNNTPPADQYLYLDHLRVSGK